MLEKIIEDSPSAHVEGKFDIAQRQDTQRNLVYALTGLVVIIALVEMYALIVLAKSGIGTVGGALVGIFGNTLGHYFGSAKRDLENN